MKTPSQTFALLLGLGLASGCQSSDKQATTAEAPAASAPTAATTEASPADGPAPTTALDIRPAIEQLLPAEGYLQVVSSKALEIEPMSVSLPPLWGSMKPNASRAAPGYRISYEAVVKWVPKGFGPNEKVPATMTLYAPNGKDSLARYNLGGVNLNIPGQEKYTVSEIEPNKPVSVRGVLYAFRGVDTQTKPALVVYPYRNKGGVEDPTKMTFLPLPQ